MPSFRFTTYLDTRDHLADFIGSADGFGDRDLRFSRRAILDAYRILPNERPWTYFYANLRLNTVAPVNTGTIAFTLTGGTYERMVTLTGATWPSWAAFGVLVINGIPYQVDQLKTSTVLTLEESSNPGSDVAALTPYTLYRDAYPLPLDFIACDQIMGMSNNSVPEHVHPRFWLGRQRYNQGPTMPWAFTIMKLPKYFGVLGIFFSPMPDQAYVYNVVYQSRPRALSIDAYKTGTVSVTNGLTTLTGVGTAFTQDHVNTVVRLAAQGAKQTPTGREGLYPSVLERAVASVTSPTSLELDTASDQSLSGVQYVLSDPVDIEEGAMLTAFHRCCEWQLSLGKSMKVRQSAYAAWTEALELAKGTDQRSLAQAVASAESVRPWRLRDFADLNINTTV